MVFSANYGSQSCGVAWRKSSKGIKPQHLDRVCDETTGISKAFNGRPLTTPARGANPSGFWAMQLCHRMDQYSPMLHPFVLTCPCKGSLKMPQRPDASAAVSLHQGGLDCHASGDPIRYLHREPVQLCRGTCLRYRFGKRGR